MDKKAVLQMIKEDITNHYQTKEVFKTIRELGEEAKTYIHALLEQITTGDSLPLIAKTPKVPKKRGTRIKAIPENDEVTSDGSFSSRNGRNSQVDSTLEISEIRPGRSKRGASVKAADIIKKQQSVTLSTKLRRPSKEDSKEDDAPLNKIVKKSGSKRPKEASSEDEDMRPSKQSKIDTKKAKPRNKINDVTHDIINSSAQLFEDNRTISPERQTRSNKRKIDDVNTTLTSDTSTRQNSFENDEPVSKKPNYSKTSNNSKFMTTLERISEKSNEPKVKKPAERITRTSSSLINAQAFQKHKTNNVINETTDMSNADETVASMYEDAIGKPIPIMNSTMNPNTTVTLEKMMNATVVIEPISTKKTLNETVTIKNSLFKEPLSRNNSTLKRISEDNNAVNKLPSTSKAKSSSKNQSVENFRAQRDMKIEKFSELITDDESSPERKDYKAKNEKLMYAQQKRVTRSNNSMSDEDEILRTPVKLVHQNKEFKGSVIKSAYKQAALFSPYAKDSVKKRVEAFEQVAISPKQGEAETGGRVTRTKTRALAAANHSEIPAPTITQKLARKSLAKAKKISLAKHTRDHEDTKENDNTNIGKPKKLSTSEKSQKAQQKTTPLGKNRLIQMPSSVSKNQYATPSNTNSLNAYSKPLTASRGNIVTNVDSFIQPVKSASKQQDRTAEEKRRKVHDEDARRKREELLKAQADEKRRKREEKELKNKLAREAKERLEYEKRLKAEKEREEKARLAQQMQEKQKEEMEKKRIAQLQRALEKEERRKQEELMRIQRLQDQEEQERLLAEQKRREQELEKRKQAELRHQMAEIKMNNHAEKMKAKAQKQAPLNYKIDSDPDEEESDDESKPKHQIPHWASRNVRQTQLAMQQHIPMKIVLSFFDAKKCTPDLGELFHGIDPKKLKRSSSAIWKTPPRYSMMNCSIIKD